MEKYSEVPLIQRRKLLETWVKCKLLLQQSIPAKTYGIGEVSMYNIIVIISMIPLYDFILVE